jgi:hypothetical protein
MVIQSNVICITKFHIMDGRYQLSRDLLYIQYKKLFTNDNS